MITIVAGKGVGSGKSYYVATRIVTHLAAGGTVVITDNYGLKMEGMREYIARKYGVIIEDSQVIQVPAKDTLRIPELTPAGTDELPVLIVVDEVQDALNARDWADANKRPLFSFAAQSRHDSTDFIFISQHEHNIDKQIGRLATFVIRVRNLNGYKLPGLGTVSFRYFLVNTYDQDGKTHLDRQFLRHDVGIFGAYESKVKRGSFERLGIAEKRLLNKAPKKRNMWKVIVCFIVGVSGVGFLALKGSSLVPGVKTAEVKPVQLVNPLAGKNVAQPEKHADKPRPYDVISEQFRGSDYRTYLRTSTNTYEVGHMSSHGFVLGIRANVVKIAGMDRPLYVVATSGVPGRIEEVPSWMQPENQFLAKKP